MIYKMGNTGVDNENSINKEPYESMPTNQMSNGNIKFFCVKKHLPEESSSYCN